MLHAYMHKSIQYMACIRADLLTNMDQRHKHTHIIYIYIYYIYIYTHTVYESGAFDSFNMWRLSWPAQGST